VKLSIRDLLLVTVIVAFVSAFSTSRCEEERPGSELPTTFWVVTDTYEFGKNTKEYNGTLMVIADGTCNP